MSDFFQNGVITTLHNLNSLRLDGLEQELLAFSKHRTMGLVLPCSFTNLKNPLFKETIQEISKIPYLQEIIIGLDDANEDQFIYAKDFFSSLPQPHKILWNDGPNLRNLNLQLINKGIAPKEQGKGRNIWFSYGYAIASAKSECIATHDSDISTNNRDLLARLFYPVANPAFNYKFSKSYYSRISNQQINGRVCRLLVTPLIRALKQVIGHKDYLDYLDSFRYALSGETAIRMDTIKEMRIPGDKGIEMGMLSEIYRNHSLNHICQVEVSDSYNYENQLLSATNFDHWLSKLSIDTALVIFRKLATQGVVLSKETFRTLKATYYREALDTIESFYSDACINGFAFDRHQEEKTVELFSQHIIQAGNAFLDKPSATPFIPSWNRVMSAIPDIIEHLNHAVEEDNR